MFGEGLSAKDPTIADLLKTRGYATGQFGKNHLGDRNEFFPTVHGFDEFFGNFYHLNAEDEPENPDYPKSAEFKKSFGPRGETQASQPWFVWFNTSRMHVWTHLRPESAGKTGHGVYADGMVEHDGHIGEMLNLLDSLGVANDTIVVWTSDNGAEVMTWPDGGTTPFHGEKNTNWEGGYRVPLVARWPGVIKPGSEINEIVAHEDWLPTLLAAAGAGNVKDALFKGILGTYKVHLDGYNLMPYFKGETTEWPRKEFMYWTDDGGLACIRYDRWKIVFMEQRAEGFDVWEEPLVTLRLPKIFKDFPPRQKPGSFNLSEAMAKMSANAAQ
jgi:arylsulfatase